ncbi:MAG TPA: penicillin-binding transpeptidase domain-containing protein [Thermoanaerobaculia bacterium]
MPKRNPLRFPLVILGLVAALLYLVWWALGIPIARGRERLLAGDAAAAAAALEPWARLRLRGEDFEQLLAAAHLLAGDDDAASAWLGRAGKRGADYLPALRREDAGRLFLGRGAYEPLLRWYAAVRVRRESDEAKLYRAGAELGAGRRAEAEATFASIDREDVDAARYSALAEAFARRAEGTVPLLTDRAGRTIAIWHLENRDLVAVNDDFLPLLDESGGRLTVEAQLERIGTAGTIETTLDPAVQKAALAAIAPWRASLVAIDPRTHQLLAVASSPGGGPRRNLAFEGLYEPGSIIKPLTALAAAESGTILARSFPLDCEGFAVIGGRRFLDWARHGRLASNEEAMAVSCNVAYANMGLALGRDRLRGLLARARFGESADLELFEVPLGRAVKPVDDEFSLANCAVGLDVLRLNALHIAMLADMFASGGTMTTPVLVRARRSILGERIDAPRTPVSNRVASSQHVAAIVPALRAVVTDVRGTGRRAAIPGVDLAMKTGTAGDASGDYDSVILAFAPAATPRIAFGIIAENAGPAELAGAEITRNFLAAVLQRDQSR